jgi:hypothetical protein
MPADMSRIERLERELAEARAELLQDDAKRLSIIMREISEEEKKRILESLTDKHEKILFGLEPPEEPRRAGASRRATSGGDLECPICGKSGLTTRGLALHTTRMHKGEKVQP